MIEFQSLLYELANDIANEMELRNISCQESLSLNQEALKIHLLDDYRTKEREGTLSKMKPRILGWAKELGIKLARPFPITTYSQEIPPKTFESGIIQHRGIILRGITDYCLESSQAQFCDRILYRFTIAATWQD